MLVDGPINCEHNNVEWFMFALVTPPGQECLVTKDARNASQKTYKTSLFSMERYVSWSLSTDTRCKAFLEVEALHVLSTIIAHVVLKTGAKSSICSIPTLSLVVGITDGQQ